jgi:alkanesulfonate monooxygenase SsuD/methylene tetrahydromethanopterin reductase-like flavin-dependent oxidoreductase (luciferase family)
VNATSLIGSEVEVAARLDSFGRIGVDRLICSPVQLEQDQRLHTIERLAALVGAPAPA